MQSNARAGYRRHPETLPYRCYLSILAGFARLCRAGPTRAPKAYTRSTGVSIRWQMFAVVLCQTP